MDLLNRPKMPEDRPVSVWPKPHPDSLLAHQPRQLPTTPGTQPAVEPPPLNSQDADDTVSLIALRGELEKCQGPLLTYSGSRGFRKYIWLFVLLLPILTIAIADSGDIKALMLYSVIATFFSSAMAINGHLSLRASRARTATLYNELDKLKGTGTFGKRYALTPDGDIELVPIEEIHGDAKR